MPERKSLASMVEYRPTIISVAHYPENIHFILKALGEESRGAKTIGFEATPFELNEIKARLQKGIKARTPEEVLAYEIIKCCDERKLKVVPLDSAYARRTGERLGLFVSSALRTKFMLRNVLEHRPDLIMVGGVHGETFKKFLKPKKLLVIKSGKIAHFAPVKALALAERVFMKKRERRLRKKIAARKRFL